METIIAACISAGSALAICMISNMTHRRRMESSSEKTIAILSYKIDELTKRVEKHNNVIDRTYKLEETAKVCEERLKVINHRIADIETEMKEE